MIALEKSYFPGSPCAQEIAFEISLCYEIGFGTKRDIKERDTWLEKSGKQQADIEAEKGMIGMGSTADSSQLAKLLEDGKAHRLDLFEDYRRLGSRELNDALKAHEQELDGISQALGEAHYLSLILQEYVASILAQMGSFKRAKEVCTGVRNKIQSHFGDNLRLRLLVYGHLMEFHMTLGEWYEAKELQEESLSLAVKIYGQEHERTIGKKADLIKIYLMQGQMEDAELLGTQVVEASKIFLSRGNPTTLNAMGRLIDVYLIGGRVVEALKLIEELVEIANRVFEPENSTMLHIRTQMALILSFNGSWKEAEEMAYKVWETSKTAFGEDN